jgi:hypothetical protein
MSPANWIALVGGIVGLVTFVKAVVEYNKGQQWKRVEFAYKELKEFEDKQSTKNAMIMLDWNQREIDLLKEAGGMGEATLVTDDLVCSALQRHDQKVRGFSEVEVAIRDIFDHFFDDLERFEYYIQCKLVTISEFRASLAYWLQIIGDRNSDRKTQAFRETVWGYIDFYGYDGVQRLCSRYKYDIRCPPP